MKRERCFERCDPHNGLAVGQLAFRQLTPPAPVTGLLTSRGNHRTPAPTLTASYAVAYESGSVYSTITSSGNKKVVAPSSN